jgi:hypothetical protein
VTAGGDEARGRQIVKSLVADRARARFLHADLERFEDVQSEPEPERD